MTFPTRPVYLTWGGVLGSGSGFDVWQTGVHLASNGDPVLQVPDSAALQTLFDDVLSPFHSHADTGISAGCTLRWVKAARLKLDGTYDAEPSDFETTAPVAGATADSRTSMIESMVVSLWSGNTLGRANYGRLYIPWNSYPTNPGTGRISNAARTAMLARATELMGGINDWATTAIPGPPPARIMIMSKLGAGEQREPAWLRVGDVVDVQRRRKDAVRELYETVAFPS